MVRREEHPLHSGAWSLCFSLLAGLACSPTALHASARPSHPIARLLACLCLLAYASIAYRLTVGILGTLYARMHERRSSAMATETHRRRFETFWHADLLNVQPEGSERFYGGFLGFAVQTSESGRRIAGDRFSRFFEISQKNICYNLSEGVENSASYCII